MRTRGWYILNHFEKRALMLIHISGNTRVVKEPRIARRPELAKYRMPNSLIPFSCMPLQLLACTGPRGVFHANAHHRVRVHNSGAC